MTIAKIYGNTKGLSPSEKKALERLYRRRIPQYQVITHELAREISSQSSNLARQIGLLVNRKGIITHVIVGDQHGIFIPNLEEFRRGAFRLKGLRCIHTTLSKNRGITDEDLTDLALLRLDGMIVIEIKNDLPNKYHFAYLLPPEDEGHKWRIETYRQADEIPYKFDEFIKELEQKIEKRCRLKAVSNAEERAILVHAGNYGEEIAMRSLEELERLAETCNVQVVDKVYQRVRKFNPAHLIGKGKLKEILISGLYLGATMVIFDQNLTPVQANNISKMMDLKVIDRTQLILDIFARHATTKGGKLQVELAQLKYTLPRLVGKGTAMSRLMGGIGGKGPGETKLEIDRRRIKQRISALEKALKDLSKRRIQRRKKRRKSSVPVFSIIGYTNAGKSTLLNRLTKSDVLVADKLFATLDPSTRLLFLNGKKILLSDTVGFITNMPKDIKTAFKATLEELEDSFAFIHVVDATSPFMEQEISATEEILEEIGCNDTYKILVFNKCDLLDKEQLKKFRKKDGILVSAVTGEGLPVLLKNIENCLKHAQYLDTLKRVNVA